MAASMTGVLGENSMKRERKSCVTRPLSSRIWDYPVKEQFGSILMQIDKAKTLPNASEGFRAVNQRDTNDFAFIHDANEIKYEAAK